ncbi:MAG TPA: DUF5615 family PIN-like protein [Candidatus Acidoferrum sp.]|nr:DUF5615 family PIN-like protein [Candidatus Acidoferrum sp.]
MNILLDECLPRKLKQLLRGHTCRTVQEAGYTGKTNGELLEIAERSGLDVLLTELFISRISPAEKSR